MAKKKKIQKKGKPGIQDFIVKVKELRTMCDPIISVEISELEKMVGPSGFIWQGAQYNVQKIIGRWTILEMDIRKKDELENNDKNYSRKCYRVELDNGYQVDLSNRLYDGKWMLIGIEPEFFEKISNA